MSEEDTPMDDDALLDGWDAYVSGRANGLDRLNSQDREVIEMLHARTWSPSPRQSFTSDLRARLTALSPHSQVVAPVVPRPTHQPPLSIGHPAAWRTRRRTALAAVMIVGLIASFGGRLGDDPPAPTVQAPVAQVTAGSLSASPAASPGADWSACQNMPPYGSEIAQTLIDTEVQPQFIEALATARYVTVQELTAVDLDPAVPPSAFTAGVTGIVFDTVVSGGARAHLSGLGTLQRITGLGGTAEGRPVGPEQTLDLVHGDLLIYPVGALTELSNAFESRDLVVVRVVLHDVRELMSGKVNDTVTLRTIGEGVFPTDVVAAWEGRFVISLPYVGGIMPDQIPVTPCRVGDGYLLATALAPVEYDDGPRLHGLLVRLQPLMPPGGGLTPTPGL